jgi:ribonuclease P/MRP protein subunit POP8
MSDVDMIQSDAHPASSRTTEKTSETTFTLRHPPYVYIYLIVKTLSPAAIVELDKVTAQSYLRSALSQFLGLTGTAIELDLLKVEGKDIWLRVAKEDASAVIAAVSQWASTRHDVSLQVKARGTWLGAVMARGRMNDSLWTM